jgi:hypothetical protein
MVGGRTCPGVPDGSESRAPGVPSSDSLTSMSTDADARVPPQPVLPRRPAAATLIATLCILMSLIPWLTFLLVSSGALRVTPAAALYLSRSAVYYYAFCAIYSVSTVAAAVALFALRKSALSLFVASLVLYVLGIALFESPEVKAGLGSYANVPEVMKVAFQTAVIYYCWRLGRAGVMR